MAYALIIDDSSTVRMFYREILEASGFAVNEAINGLEGLEKVVSEAFDVVLVDVNMPKMDGYTFMKQMRATPETQGLPAVMISTEAQPEDQTKAYSSGANIYMVKPVHPDDLAATVRLVSGHAPAARMST